jgi:hypothetical protein
MLGIAVRPADEDVKFGFRTIGVHYRRGPTVGGFGS